MTTEAQPKVKRHPIRGALWGLLMGIGVALILINFAVIALGTILVWIVIGIFIVIGILWGLFAPAKKPKGSPPTSSGDATPAYDDFDPPAEPAEPAGDNATPSEDDAG